jgi:hypothetical protein
MQPPSSPPAATVAAGWNDVCRFRTLMSRGNVLKANAQRQVEAPFNLVFGFA